MLPQLYLRGLASGDVEVALRGLSSERTAVGRLANAARECLAG
jgi:hypothetical protein